MGVGGRRPAAVALLAVAVVAAIGLAYPRHAGSPPAPPAAPAAAKLPDWSGLRAVRPRVAFWRSPYMGVLCRVPNSIGCDKVGLAVWLRRPAISVMAVVEGARLKLFTSRYSPSQWRYRPLRTGFTGYLQPAGIRTRFHVHPKPGTSRWLGAPTPFPLVRFRIDYGPGHVVVTQLRVPLMAGWG